MIKLEDGTNGGIRKKNKEELEGDLEMGLERMK